MAWLDKLTNLFRSKKQEENVEPPAKSDEPRDHHYVFAHQMMPALFFRGPSQFLDIATAEDGEARLISAWRGLGRDMEKEQPGAAMAATGLSQRTHSFGRRRAVVISFPRASSPPEGIFAALIEDGMGGQPARYIILEKTFADSGDSREIGVLCEWNGDGSRRNHQIVTTPDIDAFLAAVDEVLRREEERREAGADDVGGAAWNPSQGDSPDEAVFSFACRPQHCLFAFDALRIAAFNQIDRLVDAVRGGAEVAVLQALWDQAGERAALREMPQHSHLGALRAEIVGSGTGSFLLVALPEPISYPEAFFVAIPLLSEEGRPGRIASPPVLFTLEMTAGSQSELPYLGRLTADGRHAVLGQVPGHSAEAFLGAIDSVLQGEQLKGVGRYLMEHLVAYARLAGEKNPKVTDAEGKVISPGDARDTPVLFPERFGEVPIELLRAKRALLN